MLKINDSTTSLRRNTITPSHFQTTINFLNHKVSSISIQIRSCSLQLIILINQVKDTQLDRYIYFKTWRSVGAGGSRYLNALGSSPAPSLFLQEPYSSAQCPCRHGGRGLTQMRSQQIALFSKSSVILLTKGQEGGKKGQKPV